VIHEEYLQQMTETDMETVPSWSAGGFVFEATKFSDRTISEQVERVVLEVKTDEIGLVLKGEQLRSVLSLLFTHRARAICLTEIGCHCYATSQVWT
jgi:hypothetical protein